MENEISRKRGLVLALVVATVIVFVGLVWIIVTNKPWNPSGLTGSGDIAGAAQLGKNCTYPLHYWREHPERYPPQVVLGGKTYQADEINRILSGDGGDPASQLQAQLLGVFLNISAGADQDVIDATVFQAYGWLVSHPDGSDISESAREEQSRLYNLLEAYNYGLAGVALCPEAASYMITETVTPSQTPTDISTTSPSPTPSPSPTASPTFSPTAVLPTVIAPSHTSTPTTERPGIEPSATNTPIPTTAEPTPTNTSNPEATPTFTQPPEPSPTFTVPPPPSPTITPPPP
ncbi:MAG: hypothetical protein A2136_01420 [Chloroflexi bacterium RBG_16_54_11]|nr:MAG: hypothetical protein A2136_01420 [Chloroflexi bacterium RBG_16_54_11]